MRSRRWFPFVALMVSAGCSCSTSSQPDGGGGGAGGGSGGGGSAGAFAITDLDSNAREATYFAAAFDGAAERVGVAYFTPRGTMTMVGVPDYDLKYVEWSHGTVSAVETIRYVQRTVGLTLAFDPTNGEPVVGFLGGDSGFDAGMSIYWFQSDAAFARRSGGVWTQTVAATLSGTVACGNVVSDQGFLVGLWPAITFDSTGKMYFAWRDGHNGAIHDFEASDVELAEGRTAPFTYQCVNQGGNGGSGAKPAWGGRIAMTMGAGQPALVYDRASGGADTTGGDVFFQQRQANGSWSAYTLIIPSNDTTTGASIAYDSQLGFAVAATDGMGVLNYVEVTTPSSIDSVYGMGTGGLQPSLAFDPTAHEPAVAHYICGPRMRQNTCNQSEDSLVVSQRGGNQWHETPVDLGGGYSPKLGFFATGKRVVVYRVPPALDANGQLPANAGALKLAVER